LARSGKRASAGAEEAPHLTIVRPASFCLLREDEVAVGEDVVLGLLALTDRRVEPVGVQLGRETRGPFVIAASDGAVEDLDGHRLKPCRSGGSYAANPRPSQSAYYRA
jgi:hypothetical protein